jgi:tripartite-type tricarboxylate transporter receptor subunit TctC
MTVVGRDFLVGYVTSWYALNMPANTPAPIVQKLSHDAAEILSEPAVKAKYEQLEVLSGGSTSAELATRGRSEAKLWCSVMEASDEFAPAHGQPSALSLRPPKTRCD